MRVAEAFSQQIERELFVRRMTWTEMTENQLAQWLSTFRDVVFLKGETIYAKGAASDHIYFLSEGDVELSSPEHDSWQFTGTSVIGILDAMVDRPHSRTATAISDVKGLVLRTDDYFDFYEDNSDLTQLSLEGNAASLHEMFLKYRDPERLLLGPSETTLVRTHDQALSLVERLLVIRGMHVFRSAPTQALVALATGAREMKFSAGEVLFRQGDPSTIFWMVANGRVVAERETPRIRAVRGPGDLVENIAAFGSSERQYTATAESDVTLLLVDKEDLLDRIEEHFDLARSIMSYLGLERERLAVAVAANTSQ
jgi:CRP-like cAMP-binding protein